MRILKKIIVVIGGNRKTIFFGMPDNESELEEMFRLRYKVYVEKEKYIPGGSHADRREVDDYDRTGKCNYFIAKVDDKIIGTSRIIKLFPLPIEKEYFRFEEPEAMKKIPRNKRVEIGRLISVRYSDDVYLPRHLVLLGLVASMIEFGREEGFMGGYGAIKKKGKIALEVLNVPIHVIKDAEVIYDAAKSHDPLGNFFDDPKNPVYPLYYVGDELERYLNSIFNNNFIFRKVDEMTFMFKGFFMMKLFRFFKFLFNE